jgi:hypothetical protein
MNLTNAGKGSITLPLREGPDGAFFPARVRRDGTLAPAVPCIVASGESIEIPSWYLGALLEEPGHAARIERGQIVVTGEQPEPEQVSHRIGARVKEAVLGPIDTVPYTDAGIAQVYDAIKSVLIEAEQVSQPEPEQVSQPEPEQVSQPEPERRQRKRRG